MSARARRQSRPVWACGPSKPPRGTSPGGAGPCGWQAAEFSLSLFLNQPFGAVWMAGCRDAGAGAGDQTSLCD